MWFKCVETGFLTENAYIFDCGDALCLVDPGAEADKIQAAAAEFHKPVRFILLTHAHFDHVGAVRFFQKFGARVFLHEGDKPVLNSDFTPDVWLKGGETLHLDGMSVMVLHTPGHTGGSVCYLADDVMFSGDTLFCLEIGRCDLPTGSFADMKKSLKKLFSLAKNYRVLPGHGEETELYFERENNPYYLDIEGSRSYKE